MATPCPGGPTLRVTKTGPEQVPGASGGERLTLSDNYVLITLPAPSKEELVSGATSPPFYR